MEKTEIMQNTFLALESVYGSEVTDDFMKFIPRVVNDDVSVHSYNFLPESWLKIKQRNKDGSDGDDIWLLAVTDVVDEFDIKDSNLITPTRIILKDQNYPLQLAFNPKDNSIVVISKKQPDVELFGVIVKEYFKRNDYDEIVKARQEEAEAAVKAEEAAVEAAINKMLQEADPIDTVQEIKKHGFA